MSMTHARFAISVAVDRLASRHAGGGGTPFSFSTGNPDGKMATATRPDTGAPFEIESADDFVLTHSTSITSATFTGLLPDEAPLSDVGEVVVEIYRVFPKDSDAGPADRHFSTRKCRRGSIRLPMSHSLTATQRSGLTFTPRRGERPSPRPTPCSRAASIPSTHIHRRQRSRHRRGSAVRRNVHHPVRPPRRPLFLRAPGAALGRRLSCGCRRRSRSARTARRSRPGSPTCRAGPAMTGHRARLAARRHGHRPTRAPFNAAFSLTGTVVPEPSTWAMMLLGFAGLGFAGYRQARKARPASA